ncbi:MAG: S9 family peptidase, partial [Pseudoxanthomonas sp.]
MSNALRMAALLLAGCVFSTPALAGGHAITPDDIVDLKQVADPQITADGGRIAYTVATPQREGKPARSRIWRIDARGNGQAVELPAPDDANDNAPRWSADGQRLLFLSDRKPAEGKPRSAIAAMQVWSVGRDGNTALPLTRSPGEVLSFSFSRDQRTLAYLALDPLPE